MPWTVPSIFAIKAGHVCEISAKADGKHDAVRRKRKASGMVSVVCMAVLAAAVIVVYVVG